MQARKNTALLATVYAAAFVAGFNENLVNMALVSVMSEYGIDSVTAQWLVTGYMIVATVVVSCMAYLYRRVKLRTLFLAAAALSIVGSLIGLFAPNFPLLMVARLVQAVGTGIFIPTMMNTVLAVVPKNRLGTFMSVGSCVITFGPAFSPVVCGAMVTVFGWHSVFVIPAVAMVVLVFCCLAFVRNLENSPTQLDVPSVALSAVGLSLFVYGMAEIASDVPLAIGVLASAAVVIAGFSWRQFHCDHPLIELSPMKNRRFVLPLLLVMMAMMTTFSMSVLLPLYFEGALGMTALVAGIVILFPVLFNSAASLVSGRVMDKRGEWPLLPIGFGLIVIGLVVMVALSSSRTVFGVVVGAIIVFSGVGLVLSPSQTAGLKNLPPKLNPFGVTLMTTCLQIAACIGPSLFVGVMNSTQSAALADGIETAVAVAQGFSTSLAVATVISGVGFVVAFGFSRAVVGKKTRRKSADRHGAATLDRMDEENERTNPFSAKRGLEGIMETDPYVLTAASRVEEAIGLFMDRKVGGVPVVDEEGHAVGFLSDGDIMRYLAEQHPAVSSPYSIVAMADEGSIDERLRELIGLPVAEIATEGVVSVSAESSFEEACNVLANRKLKKVPVLKDGRVVGTINRSDVIRYAMRTLLDS